MQNVSKTSKINQESKACVRDSKMCQQVKPKGPLPHALLPTPPAQLPLQFQIHPIDLSNQCRMTSGDLALPSSLILVA
jgi:hypothetical protein